MATGTVTLKKLPLVVEDMELGRGLTYQTRGGETKTYKRIGGSTLPYDGIDGPTLKEKIDSIDAINYAFAGIHDPSGGQEYPDSPTYGEAYTVDLPLGTETHTFLAGDLIGWTCKAGDMMIYNASWTLIKISVASDDHLRLDGSNVMVGNLVVGDGIIPVTLDVRAGASGSASQYFRRSDNTIGGHIYHNPTLSRMLMSLRDSDGVTLLASLVLEADGNVRSYYGTPANDRDLIHLNFLNAQKYVPSDTTGITGADQVTNIVSLTQVEYDAIVTPDASTLYIIAG